MLENWIWHPHWVERTDPENSGALVHFCKSFHVQDWPQKEVLIHVTADTRYKLYVNSALVSAGPVKGDGDLWFYDTVDIQPHLQQGKNMIHVRVLRLYYMSSHSTSFPRTPSPGFTLQSLDPSTGFDLTTDETWATAIDLTTRLPTSQPEDQFLHIYEVVDRSREADLDWVPATRLTFPSTHGISSPWNLLPRMIPKSESGAVIVKAVHNARSSISHDVWAETLSKSTPVCLTAGTSHHIEIEVEHHTTAFLSCDFGIPRSHGSELKITYSEGYESEPPVVPWSRSKGNRRDTSKLLLGPQDRYVFGGQKISQVRTKANDKTNCETFAPFHFRTFRFLALDIKVSADADLVFKGLRISKFNYPLRPIASIDIPSAEDIGQYKELWDTSIRTLENCMHDSYEDCPFYEQLQYAMDARSSMLFTYRTSADDRLARQTIIQLHNSYRPGVGLTMSRAPSATPQIIPNFSLFWVCMVADHFKFAGDFDFTRQFLAVCDGVLETFARRLDSRLHLVNALDIHDQWDFVDWTPSWKPFGSPPAAKRTGVTTFGSMLYAYTLQLISEVLISVGRKGVANEYIARATKITVAIQEHCRPGLFFTDGLAEHVDVSSDYSQHCQIWAVLCGVVQGEEASTILNAALSEGSVTDPVTADPLALSSTSTAMSFYTLRALSMLDDKSYSDHFHGFWRPWRQQLSLNVDTWMEDEVSQRSDCHAWGCAILHEMMAEVCGITCASPGWSKIAFKPRTSLFRTMQATVPFLMKPNAGSALVTWEHSGSLLALSLVLHVDPNIELPPIYVTLPNGQAEVRKEKEVSWIIQL